MNRRWMLLFLALAGAVPILAQTPIQVTPCDLVKSPEKYAGKVVQVRARINLAFEDFTLTQPGCKDQYPHVWLMYGGDEPTPTSSTWNDLSRKPGSVVEIDGIPVPLVHDANLDLFKRRLTAIRLGKIGDAECYTDCHLYSVTATLTGLFFAAINTAQQVGGYGHLGCCHLLAIEQVADVVAKRTPIPVGTEIECSTDSIKLSQKNAERLNSMSDFHRMKAVAALWHDSLDMNGGHSDNGEISEHTRTYEWLSLNRLKQYELDIQSDNFNEDGNNVYGGTATRVLCGEVTPSLPLSANVSCRELQKKLLSTPADSAENLKDSDVSFEPNIGRDEVEYLKNDGEVGMDIAAKELGLSIRPGIKHVSCADGVGVYSGKALAGCYWIDDTGMTRIDMTLMRSWPPQKNVTSDASSWVLTSVSAIACEVER